MIDKERFETTVLEDNADIYNKEAKSERESFKQMSSKEKWQHFVNYYLIKVIVIIGAVGLVCYLVYSSFFKPKEENVLYVAVFDEILDRNEVEILKAQLEEMYDADGETKKVVINDNFYTKEDGISKLEVYLSSKVVDVIIADKELFAEFAAIGYMFDLNQLTVESIKRFSPYYFNTAGCLEYDSDEISFEDDESGKGERLPYGISLKESELYGKIGELLENPVAGIVVNSEQKENAEAFLGLFID